MFWKTSRVEQIPNGSHLMDIFRTYNSESSLGLELPAKIHDLRQVKRTPWHWVFCSQLPPLFSWGNVLDVSRQVHTDSDLVVLPYNNKTTDPIGWLVHFDNDIEALHPVQFLLERLTQCYWNRMRRMYDWHCTWFHVYGMFYTLYQSKTLEYILVFLKDRLICLHGTQNGW